MVTYSHAHTILWMKLVTLQHFGKFNIKFAQNFQNRGKFLIAGKLYMGQILGPNLVNVWVSFHFPSGIPTKKNTWDMHIPFGKWIWSQFKPKYMQQSRSSALSTKPSHPNVSCHITNPSLLIPSANPACHNESRLDQCEMDQSRFHINFKLYTIIAIYT